jgi:hypothetical protein
VDKDDHTSGFGKETFLRPVDGGIIALIQSSVLARTQSDTIRPSPLYLSVFSVRVPLSPVICKKLNARLSEDAIREVTSKAEKHTCHDRENDIA